ncbi:putative MFS transporter Fmp42 [Aspergillus affinis]|uniref:putative MFS transporter Fmp42 n=1 Tax=Aspergillus affinis TaxID=1070780 RepID=UPI0022FDD133|nr:uncharacterized protein KD926_005898 [Aspergillus affinis]KAI9045954.1 hypothetical protein KD926_005898 [Aspergillus affinis]
MSLNRLSYLESWVQNPASFRRRPREQSPADESDDDELAYHDLPEPSLSSSFPSTYSHNSFRHRLNFNPYSGPGWNEPSVDEANADRISTRREPLNVPAQDQENQPERAEPVPEVKPRDWNGLETIGAFEVGRTRRILQVCIAILYCFFSAGIVFGFAAIKPVFLKEGVYREQCSTEELEGGQAVCYGQEIRLNLMFTIAAVATNVSALPVGTILDTYGPRVCGVLGCVFLILGSLLLSLAPAVPFDAYIPGYLALSVGGPFVFISSFQLSNTFPTHSGLILSSLTGAFDASSALFLIFRLASEASDGRFTSQKFFLGYLVVPLFILVVQLTIMPATSYKTAGELVQQAEVHISAELNDRLDAAIQDRNESERQRIDRRVRRRSIVSKIQDLLTDGDDDATSVIADPILGTNPVDANGSAQTRLRQQHQQSQQTNTHTAGGVWGALHGRSALQQIRSPWFVLITLFTVLQMLRINYFVASLRQQYEYLFGSRDAARRLNESFDFLLPIGGLLSIPFIGTIIDTASTPFVLLVLATTATVIGILGCIPDSLQAGYANIVLFVIYRPFYYTLVSDYAAKVFGFQTFGKVYGLIICLAGLGNFAQAGLDVLTFKTFRRNPIPINIVLTALTFLVGFALVVFVWQKARNMATGPGGTSANGNLEQGVLADGFSARDWEHEPLLQRRVSPANHHGEMPSYETTTTSTNAL